MKIDKRKFAQKIKDKYSFANETFSRRVKAHPKDRIDVEIGDSKQPDFKPQFKVMRWDNEVNLSFRLKDDGIEEEIVDTKADTIIWKKGKREAHFYDIQNAEHPEGAYEFEVVLLEKPATNVVEFSLNTKGLDFFYQGVLTPEQIAEGITRPENVIGSYAVYASEQKINWTGGKEYKCGKVGHIYRPQVEDANGMKVWGELNVDTINGTLSVTIPQEFLDNAVYPVRHAAGLTFGYTSIGASSGQIASATSDTSSQVGTGNFTLSEAGTLDSLHVALVSSDGDTEVLDVFMALWDENTATDSHARVASVERTNLSVDGVAAFYTFTAASESLSADTYIISAVGNGEKVVDGTVNSRFDSSPTTFNSYGESTTGAGSYNTRKNENPWTETDTGGLGPRSLYATYTASSSNVGGIGGYGMSMMGCGAL